MIHSSCRDRKTKAIAEMLAMIAATELAPHGPRPVRETGEWLSEDSATEFSAALDKYCAEHKPGRKVAEETHGLIFFIQV